MLWKRLKLYIFGLGIGTILVFLFFGDRVNVLTSWFPSERIKSEILFKMNEKQIKNCLHLCAQLDYDSFLEKIKSNEVDFSASSTRSEIRKYLLKGDYDLAFSITDSVAFLSSIEKGEKHCICDTNDQKNLN